MAAHASPQAIARYQQLSGESQKAAWNFSVVEVRRRLLVVLACYGDSPAVHKPAESEQS